MPGNPHALPPPLDLDLARHHLVRLADLGSMALRQAYGGRLDLYQAEGPEHPSATAFAVRVGIPLKEILSALDTVSGKSAPPPMFS